MLFFLDGMIAVSVGVGCAVLLLVVIFVCMCKYNPSNEGAIQSVRTKSSQDTLSVELTDITPDEVRQV